MWLLLWLPYPVLMKMGEGVGWLLMKTMKSRVKVTRRNLELCFPDMPQAEREALVKQNFKETGKAAFETFIGWWWPDWRARPLCHFTGKEHIQAILDQGKGVLLLSGHFLSLEMIARTFGFHCPAVGFYRPNDNEIMEYFQYHGRVRSNRYLIGKRDVRTMIKALNEKEVCFYLPDQDYGRNKAEFVPFLPSKKQRPPQALYCLPAAPIVKLCPFIVTVCLGIRVTVSMPYLLLTTSQVMMLKLM